MLLCCLKVTLLLIEFFTGAGSWSQLDPVELEQTLFHFIILSLCLQHNIQ
jgi:hypothetical protein